MGRSRDGKDERCSKVIRKGKAIQQNVSCKAQSTAIGDGRQKLARQLGWGRLRRFLQYEKERGGGREMWKKDEGGCGKTARAAGLYTLEKAAGEAMSGALPEEATLNPKGPLVSPSPKIAYPGRYEHRNNAPSQGDI